MKYTLQVSILYSMFVERRTNTPSFLFNNNFIIVLNLKLFVMQESIDNDLREILTREEELWMMTQGECIKHILRLESYYYANQNTDTDLPW